MAKLEPDQYDFLYKTVLAGDSSVGKTNILSRLLGKDFVINSKATIGVDFGVKTYILNDKKIKVQLWDTAGQERYRAISSAYYRMAVGVIIVFDITSKKTFDNIEKWIDEILMYTQDASIMIIGNKTDLSHLRDVSYEEAQLFATKRGYKYIEASAKDNTNIDDAMVSLIENIYEKSHKDFNSDDVYTPVLPKPRLINPAGVISICNPDEPVLKQKKITSCCS